MKKYVFSRRDAALCCSIGVSGCRNSRRIGFAAEKTMTHKAATSLLLHIVTIVEHLTAHSTSVTPRISHPSHAPVCAIIPGGGGLKCLGCMKHTHVFPAISIQRRCGIPRTVHEKATGILTRTTGRTASRVHRPRLHLTGPRRILQPKHLAVNG